MIGALLNSNPFAALVVALLLFAAGRPIIVKVTAAEGKPWLERILTISLVLHLLAGPAQIFVIDHFYKGVADWNRYVNRGALLAPGFRHFDFNIRPGSIGGIVSNGSVSIAAAIVFALFGINQIGAFFVFAWLSWVGCILFFRAFSLTFGGVGSRRYAYVLFFLPSIIFWTADVSKEAIMLLSLGVATYGAAKVLARRRGGISLVLLGCAIGVLIRPNELLVAMAGFTVAMMVAPATGRRARDGTRRVARTLFFGALLGTSIFLTLHYLHSANGSLSLTQTAKNNSGTGVGFGSSGIPYSTSPLTYPRDVYEVLFNPLPINFHGTGELIAAAENSFVLGLILCSLRQLRMVPRAAFARSYVMLCLVFSLLFFYAFAALGNLGLITRERTLLFPYLLVLLCIPRTPKGLRPRYEWEYRRRDRKRLRAAGFFRPRPAGPPPSPAGLPSGVAADRPSTAPSPSPVPDGVPGQ